VRQERSIDTIAANDFLEMRQHDECADYRDDRSRRERVYGLLARSPPRVTVATVEECSEAFGMEAAGKGKRCERQRFKKAVHVLFGRRGRPQLRCVADVPEHHAFMRER